MSPGLVGGASSSLVVTAGARTLTVPVIVKEVGLPLTVDDMAKFTATYQMIGAAVHHVRSGHGTADKSSLTARSRVSMSSSSARR